MDRGTKYLPLPKDARVMLRQNIRYPSVTTVLSGVDPINFPEIKLRQYAARGSIWHAQIRHFLRTGIWETDLLKIPRNEDERQRMLLDIHTLQQGNLRLRLSDCNFLGFWETYGKDFKPWKGGVGDEIFFNDQYVYTGSPDWPCLYKDEPAIVDFKGCVNYPAAKVRKFKKQTSAYAKCEADGVIKHLIIVPLNARSKKGFTAPIVEHDIDNYFNLFVEDRLAFSAIFGI